MPKVQYVCVDCGELSAWKHPNHFSQPKESYRCRKCAMKKLAQDPTWRGNNSKSKRGKPHSDDHKKKIGRALKGRPLSEERKKKLIESHTGKPLSDDHKKKLSEALTGEKNPNFGKQRPIEIKKRISGALTGEKNPNFGKQRPEITKKKIGEAHVGIHFSEESRINISCGKQGISREEYTGHAREQKYCEAFTEEFKERVRAFHEYTCPFTGMTEDELGETLHVHHVYWQKSSCCILDDGDKPYFVIKGQKHHYTGDSNKFVPIPAAIHRMMAGNKDTSCIEWVKILEDYINTRYNGRSYYNREEYWGNGWYHYEGRGKPERYCDAITGEIYGKHLIGWQGYGEPKKVKSPKIAEPAINPVSPIPA